MRAGRLSRGSCRGADELGALHQSQCQISKARLFKPRSNIGHRPKPMVGEPNGSRTKIAATHSRLGQLLSRPRGWKWRIRGATDLFGPDPTGRLILTMQWTHGGRRRSATALGRSVALAVFPAWQPCSASMMAFRICTFRHDNSAKLGFRARDMGFGTLRLDRWNRGRFASCCRAERGQVDLSHQVDKRIRDIPPRSSTDSLRLEARGMTFSLWSAAEPGFPHEGEAGPRAGARNSRMAARR